MFRLSSGMSPQQFAATGKTAAELGFAKMEPKYVASDEDVDVTNSATHAALSTHGWRSGEITRDAVVKARVWDDGAPYGRGHGSPYLKPEWAKRMHDRQKTIEGRPDEGVHS